MKSQIMILLIVLIVCTFLEQPTLGQTPGNRKLFHSTTYELLSSINTNKRRIDPTCFEKTDCGTCRASTLSDGVTPCVWYYSYNYAYCDSNRTASPYEYQGDTTCEDITCEGCLEAGGAWTLSGTCLVSCHRYNEQEGSTCFALDDDETTTISDQCEVANTLYQNWQTCRSADDTDCETCTTTLQLDGTPCNWYDFSDSCEPTPVTTKYSVDNPQPSDCTFRR